MKNYYNKYITTLIFLTLVLIFAQNKSLSQDLFDDSFLGSSVPVAPVEGEEKEETPDTVTKKGVLQPKTIEKFKKDTLVPFKTRNDYAPTGNKKDILSRVAKPSVDIIGLTPSDIFKHMADLERENAILNLEIQRQKLQSTIEGIERERRESLLKEDVFKKEQQRKEIEWQEERERKRQEELAIKRKKDLEAKKEEIENEKDKHINALKKSLEDQRRVLIERVNRLEKEKVVEMQEKASFVKNTTETIRTLTKVANKKIADAEIVAKMACPVCPVCPVCMDCPICPELPEKEIKKVESEDGEEFFEDDKASDIYSIIEIKGKNKDLIARLTTSSGVNFFVRKGTVLGTGHIVSDIQKTHVLLKRSGQEERLIFPAGGILDAEPEPSSEFDENSSGDSSNDEKTTGGQKPKAPAPSPQEQEESTSGSEDSKVRIRAPFSF